MPAVRDDGVQSFAISLFDPHGRPDRTVRKDRMDMEVAFQSSVSFQIGDADFVAHLRTSVQAQRECQNEQRRFFYVGIDGSLSGIHFSERSTNKADECYESI